MESRTLVAGPYRQRTPASLRNRVQDFRPRSATRHARRYTLGIGPQCGFASTAAGNPLAEADERAKLGLVVAAARAI